jgi:hypothetical protein
MPNNLHKTFVSILIFLLLPWVLQGHGDHEQNWDWEKVQPFKERIHGLCSGHGLMHMEDAVLNSILDRFAKHSNEVVQLQEAAPDDNYLVQLTVLIHRSNLSPDQKQEGYRRSYEIVLKNLKSGDEWKRTLWFLLRDTDALTQEEIRTHLEAKDPGVRADAKKALEKLQTESQEKPEGNSNSLPSVSTSDSTTGNDIVNPDGWSKGWIALGAGMFLVAGLLLYQIIKRQ